MVDEFGQTALNVSIGTCGLQTARLWLALGYDFGEKLPNGSDNVFMACEYDFVKALEFLKSEAMIPLFSTFDGVSTLEYSLRVASFKCFAYLIDYYIQNDVFLMNPYICQRVVNMLQAACKTLLWL